MEVREYRWLATKQWIGSKAKATMQTGGVGHFWLYPLGDSDRCSLDFILWAKRSFNPGLD